MGREALYVAMTRGRDANTVYVATDHPDPDCDHPDLARPDDGPRDVLTRILQTPTGEHSATETRQTAAEDAASLRRLVPIRATIAAALDRRRWPRLLEQAGLTREQTEQIHQSPAAGALYAELRHAEHLGHRAATVTAALARQAPLDDADDLAAVLHHRLGTWLATAPDLTDAGETPAVERLGLTDRGSTGQSALDDDLAHVDALIHHRADEVTTRLSANLPGVATTRTGLRAPRPAPPRDRRRPRRSRPRRPRGLVPHRPGARTPRPRRRRPPHPRPVPEHRMTRAH